MTEQKEKSSKIQNALLIGFCAGIIAWSILKSTWGLFTLIPLYFIYKLMNRSETED